jgi:hypothetical protein
MRALGFHLTRPTVLWLALGFMALAGIGSVAQLHAQAPPSDCLGEPCGPGYGVCPGGCFCDYVPPKTPPVGQCVSL